MKKAKLLSVIALTFIGSLFLFSCGKEEVPGPQGEQGIQGETGIGIESIEKSGSEGLVDIYTITFSDGTTSTFTVTNGKDGVDGTQGIQGIQGEPGEDGHTPVITIQEGYWYIDGENTNVLAEGIKGDTGNGVSDVKLTNTEGLVDTYTITFTNGTTSTFTLTNGKDGVGIEKVEYDENGNLLIYFTNGTSDVVELPKHNHVFGNWVPFKCEDSYCESRLLYRICDECGDIQWREGKEEDHIWETTTIQPTYEQQGYDINTCSLCGKVEINNYFDIYERIKVTSSDITWLQGGVDSTNGNVTTSFTNNWYADIKIPDGAEVVKFLTFKTAGKWGSAFFDNEEYISGYCDAEKGQQWVTIDIPDNASTFRYGYLQDWKTEADGLEMFEYVEFIGQNIEYCEQITEKLDLPLNKTHAFSVKVDISSITNKEEDYIATDYGYIMLPRNYSKDGEAVRLIITCHGAAATLSSYQQFQEKIHSQTYWLEMGYAIMDMFACPPLLANGKEMHYGNPVVLECYEKGYEYVMKRFNLKNDGIFVLGSSMGGLSSFQIVQSGKFPVLAQIANCPVIDLFKQAYCNPWTDGVYQRDKIAYYFGFEGDEPIFTNIKHVPTKEEVKYFVDNFDKVKQYSPITAKVISGDSLLTTNHLSNDATIENPDEALVYEQLSATHPCPLLIIHNKDDATVSYRYSVYFSEMLIRGGADVTLKLYDSGGHNAWDNGTIGEIVNSFGETINLSESRRLSIEFFKDVEDKL